MAQRFSDVLRDEALVVWERIFSHPFIREAESAVLPIDKFRYYVIQDFHYLEGFGRTVALALSKAPDAETLLELAPRVNTPIERPLHAALFRQLDIDEAEVDRVAPSPTTKAYVNHMLTTAFIGGVGEAAAALLPCPWSYHELGTRVSPPDHPVFGPWLNAYSAGLLQESTAAWRQLVDRFGVEAGPSVREAMRRAFMTSSRYEYMFWTMAYQMEHWPV